jgi:hypothetical protein
LAVGKHTAIPRTDADTTDPNFLQAIANTAGLHMPTIEQGGNSLYPAMAQRASGVEVLRILISIRHTETVHFQTWADKARNATVNGGRSNNRSFGDPPRSEFPAVWWRELPEKSDHAPEPCPFISRKLPKCSVIRPTETKGIAMGVVNFLTAMGLFIGHSPAFFSLMRDLAEDADEAKREH